MLRFTARKVNLLGMESKFPFAGQGVFNISTLKRLQRGSQDLPIGSDNTSDYVKLPKRIIQCDLYIMSGVTNRATNAWDRHFSLNLILKQLNLGELLSIPHQIWIIISESIMPPPPPNLELSDQWPRWRAKITSPTSSTVKRHLASVGQNAITSHKDLIGWDIENH